MTHARRTTAALTVAGLALLLGACAPGTFTNKPVSNEPTNVSTKVKDEKATIRVAGWDNTDLFPQLIAKFNKEYPNITVKYEYTQSSDYQKTVKLLMQSDDPPDIAQYNTPMRDLSAAGLVLDLDPYAKAYGWDKTVAPSLMDQTRFSADGTTMGTGHLYAVPYCVPVVGVFENTTLAAEAGITGQPATIGQFEDNLAKAKAAGLQPLEIGALDFGGIHNWSALLDAYSDGPALRSWLYGDQGANIANATTDEATATLRRWSTLGYYPADAVGTDDVDAAAAFAEGKSVYFITGSWYGGQFQQSLGDHVEFHLLPPKEPGAGTYANASVGAFSISSKSKHPNAAAAFLNFLLSEQAGPLITSTGQLSPNPAANTGLTGVFGQINDAFNQVVADDGALSWPDQTTPPMLDLLTSDLQEVLAGKKPPTAVGPDAQRDWADYHH